MNFFVATHLISLLELYLFSARFNIKSSKVSGRYWIGTSNGRLIHFLFFCCKQFEGWLHLLPVSKMFLHFFRIVAVVFFLSFFNYLFLSFSRFSLFLYFLSILFLFFFSVSSETSKTFISMLYAVFFWRKRTFRRFLTVNFNTNICVSFSGKITFEISALYVQLSSVR